MSPAVRSEFYTGDCTQCANAVSGCFVCFSGCEAKKRVFLTVSGHNSSLLYRSATRESSQSFMWLFKNIQMHTPAQRLTKDRKVEVFTEEALFCIRALSFPETSLKQFLSIWCRRSSTDKDTPWKTEELKKSEWTGKMRASVSLITLIFSVTVMMNLMH